MFVNEGLSRQREIASMPGIHAHTLASLVEEAKEVEGLGVPAVLLFGVPKAKDGQGSSAWQRDGIAQRGIRELKRETGLVVIADLCLCEYTSHGHCGLVRDGTMANDETNELYARIAVSQAEAGADMVAPSGMTDGVVGAVRTALDEAGYAHIPIMAYSAKYASSFYGPFREAAESLPRFGDRRTHQMDPANAREALREMELDVQEGADVLMVKPALAYLDVLVRARARFDMPLAAYNVSGEYSMVKAAAERGWLDGERAMEEALLSIKRAGADVIITYFAKEMAKALGAG
jgi:porphobilinogen synthase